MMGMMKNLSDEQRTAIHAKAKAMKAEGATHAEIRAAMQEMVKGDAEATTTQAIEEKPAKSTEKGNGNRHNWLTRVVFSVGGGFKAVAGAIVGVFS